MVRYFCDWCGCEVDESTGVIRQKEITIELGDRKVCVQIGIEMWSENSCGGDDSALCASCLMKRLKKWNDGDEVEARVKPQIPEMRAFEGGS